MLAIARAERNGITTGIPTPGKVELVDQIIAAGGIEAFLKATTHGE